MIPLSTQVGTGVYVASETHIVHAPRKRFSKRALIIHGGWGQTALDGLAPAVLQQFAAENGAPTMFADFSDGKTWGNATGQSRVSSAWSFMQSTFGVKTDKVVLYGASMGAMVCLRWAMANPSNVAAIMGMIPANSLVDLHDSAPGITAGQKTDMETKLGVSGTYAGNGTITAIDPFQNPSSFSSIPMLLFYSGDDTTVRPATVTGFATAVGSNVTAVNMGNYGHGAATGTAGDAVIAQASAFLERYFQ